ncbi:hypothetical protein [Proteiniborus sp. MB09-C3]|uniref:hypothetical protein n=1 Tax=Proteiniborus sp. MB09-C3 TaxID=3050072 RepID=UPI002555F2E1|nr:hypothetical protein [Proteiniborus sp. MB09-C3]WIV13802.1 hypothetical protein QO263_08925 [Proteiniborus sp. MB09-C3]
MEDLSLIQKTAMTFIKEFISGINSMSSNESLSVNNVQLSYSALKWILESRSTIEIPEDQLDEVLDKTAILLAVIYKDKENLPTIADLIFERHRKCCFNHDLIWAFFESCDINSLYLIANKLLSAEPKDVTMARELLDFIPEMNSAEFLSNEQLYSYFVNWFEENSLFLHYTGESYNLTSNPIPYEVILEAKYLCKPVSVNTGHFMQNLTNKEHMLLSEFNKLDYNTQNLLSQFSYRMHHMNKNWWNIWITYPIPYQIMYANTGIGGTQ